MFDFVRKPEIWRGMDAGWDKQLAGKLSFQLKTMQDIAIYAYLREMSGKRIAEIGGGESRILPLLKDANECFNIEPFEGADNGPESEIFIDNVQNIRTTVGAFDPVLEDSTFDTLFSISVVEHVPDEDFQSFFNDCVRILKPGGVMYHAIDLYVADEPSVFWENRYKMYRNAVNNHPDVEPISDIFEGPLAFTPDMASNPDQIMHGWKTISPALNDLRQIAQSVSLKIGVRRR
ncbi:MAG: class I SAM-dependent methyltransferase [Pseudomonadota bacterium]